uniref:Uncharacterized protein n=1 Tax=Rhizophora mucronata TaxID=61149 RepID=A0A2P2PKP7_RHIMU
MGRTSGLSDSCTEEELAGCTNERDCQYP